jgi:PAS domain S-box-containing protein
MVQRKKKSPVVKKEEKPTSENKNIPVPDQQAASIEDAMDDDAVEDLFNEVEDYAIIQLDINGVVKSWNKGAEQIKGYKPHEIIGKNYRMFYTSEDKAEKLSDRLLAEAKQRGRTSYEGWRVRKDGTRFWGSMTLTTLHNKAGKAVGFLKVTRDLTAKKMAEDNYSNFVEELKIKNEELAKSEERYHKMVSEVRDYAIILLDREGRVLDWNEGAEKMKGYTAEEIVGKNFRLFYPKEEKDARLPQSLLLEAEKNGSVTHEGWRLRKNGDRFWGNIVITALHDQAGEIIGFSKVTRDLSDKKIIDDKLSNLIEELRQSNDELKTSEQRYHKMIAEVQDYAIILLDEMGNIENWNAGAQVIKGYTESEIIGKSFKIFYSKEDQRAGLPQQLLNEARTKGKVTHEGWRVRKDGSKFWGSVVITALHDDANKVIGFSKVTRDLTERREAEEATKRTAAQLDLKNKTLERLNSELSSFTYIASHDLKEPLRKIKTFTSRIRDADFSKEKSEEYLAKIEFSAQRMQRLIENLLSYSQVTNDEGAFEKVDLNEVLQSVKNDLELMIDEKNARVKSTRLPVISGVHFQLHQLFLNLISNALKFCKEDIIPEIKIAARVIKGPDLPSMGAKNGSNKYHHLSFADNGIGFAPEHADKIFEAFQRLNVKGAIGGTGIGLAIVKKVVENHNGIISAEGNPGRGAVFNVYIPIEN